LVLSPTPWRAYLEARDAAFTTWLNTMMPLESEEDPAKLQSLRAAADEELEIANAEAWRFYLEALAKGK
jgi:hypothetical protein